MQPKNVKHFKTAAAFRDWLVRNGTKVDELWVGYYKKASGKVGITYSESLDEALAHGWIDGIRKSVDGDSYTIRFTPRRARSIWSAVNVERVSKLIAAGRMTPQGVKAFEARDAARTAMYLYERGAPSLTPELEKVFSANRKARAFFDKQPPYYRRMAIWWIVSARRQDTRERRLATLVEDSASGRRLAGLTKTPSRTADSR